MNQPAEIDRFARSQIVYGGSLVVLGGAAVIWPETLLVPALIAVGVASVITGAYQMSSALAVRETVQSSRLLFAHAALVLAFGFLTVGVTAFAFFTALAIVGTWLFLHAFECGVAAIVLPLGRETRAALIAWAALHIATAILIVRYSVGTTLALIFLGAIYAAVFGAAQLVAGYVLHSRILSVAFHADRALAATRR